MGQQELMQFKVCRGQVDIDHVCKKKLEVLIESWPNKKPTSDQTHTYLHSWEQNSILITAKSFINNYMYM